MNSGADSLIINNRGTYFTMHHSKACKNHTISINKQKKISIVFVQETTTPSVIRESEITKKLSSKHGDFVASFFSSGLWAD